MRLSHALCAAALVATSSLALTGCSSAKRSNDALQREVQTYLDDYGREYQRLVVADQEAQWASNTHIVPGDTTNAARTKATGEALAKFTGSTEAIAKIRGYLEKKDELTPLQARQLEVMLYMAGNSPQTVPDVVKERIAAEAAQTEALYGYTFRIGRKVVTPNQIDSLLINSTDLAQRRATWEASKEIGKSLKPGLVKLRDLRNKAVQGLGYSDFFSYQVSDYGMSTPEMLALCDTLMTQLRPLYRELHTWARYELAKKYGQPVPDYLPADWLPNRWGQSWEDLVQVQGLDLNAAFRGKTPEWIVKAGEDFYKQIGFSELPASFWTKSSLWALPANSPYKKNTHASAWHIDLDHDVRSLMSVEPNPEWYGTVHHELGHIYYFLAYSTPEVPIVLRQGANRAYHEGIGTMMELASSQRRFLVGRGLAPADVKVDTMAKLLKEALNYIVFMPFSAGTMTHFEYDLYAKDLPPNQFNARWWDYVKKYQGIVPPTNRGEEYADAATKTHINDDAGQYYDYAISNALLFQLHEHIAKNILRQDPHDTDYYGNKGVGDFLKQLMAPGASKPWRDVLKQTTGRPLDAQAMVEYFKPLEAWLKEQNKGRVYTL